MSKLSIVLRASTGAARPNLRVRVKNVDTDAYVLDTDDDTLVDNGDGSYTSAADVSAMVYSVYTGDSPELVDGYDSRSHAVTGYTTDADDRMVLGTGADLKALAILNEDLDGEYRTLEVVHKARGDQAGSAASAGTFIHSYTDFNDNNVGYHPVRVDNVGRDGSILYLANAFNTNVRSDLDGSSSSSVANSDYLWCYEAWSSEGNPTVQSCDLFRLTYDGELYWPGNRRAGSSNENDPAMLLWGGNPSYMNASNYAFQFKTTYSFGDGLNRFANFKAGSTQWMAWGTEASGTLMAWDFGANFDLGVRLKALDGYFEININDDSERFRVHYNDQVTNYKHQFSQGGTPTGTDAGEFWFDTNLNKPFWWSGSAWVDATGAAHP